MELREYLHILRKRWVTVLAVAAGVLALAVAVTVVATPQYEAKTRLFFAVPTGDSVTDLAQGSTFTERQMSSYAEVATSPLVLRPVLEELELDLSPAELAESIRATVPLNTVILEISATDDDPEAAAEIANAVGRQLSEAVGDLYPERGNGAQAVLATMLTPAAAPSSATSPNLKANLGLGLFLGVLLGVGTALLREALDTKIRSEREVAQVTDHSLLGSVVFDARAPEHPIVMQDDPHGQRAESIRRLRTNLQFIDVDGGPRSILVTSSVPSEGKTTTVVNLALALADAGSRVLLIDADLRRPSVAAVMGLEGAAGLTTALIGQAGLDDVIQPWRTEALDVLTSGPIPPNPSELLGSRAMSTLLEDVTGRYDVVLVDSPPLLPVTDAAILSRRTSGTLLVIGTDRIHKGELQQALEALEAVDGHVVGLVLNKVAVRELSAYASSYAYTYRADAPGRDEGPAMATGSGGEQGADGEDGAEIERDRDVENGPRPGPALRHRTASTTGRPRGVRKIARKTQVWLIGYAVPELFAGVLSRDRSPEKDHRA